MCGIVLCFNKRQQQICDFTPQVKESESDFFVGVNR